MTSMPNLVIGDETMADHLIAWHGWNTDTARIWDEASRARQHDGYHSDPTAEHLGHTHPVTVEITRRAGTDLRLSQDIDLVAEVVHGSGHRLIAGKPEPVDSVCRGLAVEIVQALRAAGRLA